MASKHGGSTGINTTAVPLAGERTEYRAVEGEQCGVRSERSLMPKNAGNAGFSYNEPGNLQAVISPQFLRR